MNPTLGITVEMAREIALHAEQLTNPLGGHTDAKASFVLCDGGWRASLLD